LGIDLSRSAGRNPFVARVANEIFVQSCDLDMNNRSFPSRMPRFTKQGQLSENVCFSTNDNPNFKAKISQVLARLLLKTEIINDAIIANLQNVKLARGTNFKLSSEGML
jgi:hypothetical protein